MGSHAWAPIDDETPFDLSESKDRGIRNREALNRAEAENIRKATVKYLSAKPSKRTAPFTYAWALRVHREMLGDVWKWAGKPRQCDLNIGVPWARVQTDLEALFLDMDHWKSKQGSILEEAVTIHYRAVHIHPFQGGNGRWSRLLANIWLRRHDYPVIEWPTDVASSESPIRSDYILALQAADQHDLGPLIELHRRHWPFTG
jgi:Fic-DOC domain mobile mystery protein B